MVHAIMLFCAIIADGGQATEPTAADRAAYEAAAGKAGKNTAAHVQLALWCEAHGLSAERSKHLNVAMSLDPASALARGLLGLVTYHGKSVKPEAVKQELADDPKYQALFREYQDRRVRTPQKNAEAQLRLAAWCLEKGLKDEAMAHYHLVTRLDPSRDIAWIRLGYKKYKNRWFKPDDLAARKVDADRQKPPIPSGSRAGKAARRSGKHARDPEVEGRKRGLSDHRSPRRTDDLECLRQRR